MYFMWCQRVPKGDVLIDPKFILLEPALKDKAENPVADLHQPKRSSDNWSKSSLSWTHALASKNPQSWVILAEAHVCE